MTFLSTIQHSSGGFYLSSEKKYYILSKCTFIDLVQQLSGINKPAGQDLRVKGTPQNHKC